MTRQEIAVEAMKSIIADPTVLECEDIPCPECTTPAATGRFLKSGYENHCPTCGANGMGKGRTIKASCARSVAIKAVRYADELIAELERTKQ